MSDGCRYKQTNTSHSVYAFSNTSLDISNLFKEYLEKCQIKYTCRQHQSKTENRRLKYITSIYRKDQSALMDQFVGGKS